MRKAIAMKHIIPTIALLLCSAAHAAPTCLPAALALTNDPVGPVLAGYTIKPAVHVEPLIGSGVYWYCREPNGSVSPWELHTTWAALLAVGGATTVQAVHAAAPASSISGLMTRSKSCIAWCAGKGMCVNPAITDPDEKALCVALESAAAKNWPK
jgi:hypothetical protein